MKRLILAVVLTLFIAAPAFGQPTPEPEAKAPVTKVAPGTKAPASAPVAPVVVAHDAAPVAHDAAPEPAEKPAVAPVETEGYGSVAIKHAMRLGFLLLTLLLSGLVTVFLKKFGFQAQNEKIQSVLEKAAAFAEQWAIKKAKVDGEPKPGGPEKMDKALEFAMGLATEPEYKLTKKAKDWWEGQLESWLGVKNGG